MNYDMAWFIGPLGRLISHHKRTASEFVFNRAETNLLRKKQFITVAQLNKSHHLLT